MKKFILYVRVSSQEQADFGHSLEAQVEKCRHYIEAQDDAILVDIFQDAGYGGSLSPNKRPALNRLLEEARAKTDRWGSLLIWKLDRLSRSLFWTLEIQNILCRANKGLESVTERLDTSTASGRMFFNVISSFNELESGLVSDRTMSTMSTLVGKQHLGGKPPLGYKLNGNSFVIDANESKVVKLIFESFLRLKGYNKVAKYLNELNIPTSTGKQWSHGQVSNILKQPAYSSGDLVWNKTNRRRGIINSSDRWIVKEAAFDAIISRKTFLDVQQLQQLQGLKP